LHLSWFIIVNTTCFLTWIATFTKSYISVWFLYPLFGWGILLGIHFCLSKYRGNPNRFLYLHVTAFSLINLFLFVTYLATNGDFPWFIVVLLALAIPLMIHWNIQYHPRDPWRMHWTIFAICQVLVFLVWEMAGNLTKHAHLFPFFFIPMVIWGIILGVHYWKNRPVQPKTLTINVDVDNTTDFTPKYTDTFVTQHDPEDEQSFVNSGEKQENKTKETTVIVSSVTSYPTSAVYAIDESSTNTSSSDTSGLSNSSQTEV